MLALNVTESKTQKLKIKESVKGIKILNYSILINITNQNFQTKGLKKKRQIWFKNWKKAYLLRYTLRAESKGTHLVIPEPGRLRQEWLWARAIMGYTVNLGQHGQQNKTV